MPANLQPAGKSGLRSPFDVIRRIRPDGSEYWLARELMRELNYPYWRTMSKAIKRARTSCRVMGNDPTDHFGACANMIDIGKGARRKVPDVELTRYACSLVAMNGDPNKPEVGAAQGYFAVMTHVAEVHGLNPTSRPAAQLTAPPAQLDQAQFLTMLEGMATLVRANMEQDRQLTQHDGRLGRAETGIIGLKENLTELIEIADENGNKLTTIATKVDQVIAGQQQPVKVEIVPSTKIPPLTLRARIHQLVNDYVARTQGDYGTQWRRLHDQARYRLHYDVRARARHSGRKSLLDQAEHDGRIVEYYDLACELFNIESFTPTVPPARTNGVQVNRLAEEVGNGEG
jgi:hypothetical protein